MTKLSGTILDGESRPEGRGAGTEPRSKAIGALATVLFALTAGVANADDAALSPQQQQGKRAYNHICVYCHSPGVWGTNRLSKRMDKEKAVLENRTDLSAALVQTVVRTGIGSMPPLRKSELSDADLAAVAAYLTRAR
jgi:(+)-pinoresinol hydroxylase